MGRPPVFVVLHSTTPRPFLSDIKLTVARQGRAVPIRFANSGALGYTIRRQPARFGRLRPAGEEAWGPSWPKALHKLVNSGLIVVAQPNQ